MFNVVRLIEKKRDKHSLTDEELLFFVEGVTSGSIPDYQISAFLMATLLNGMKPQEITALTDAMARSGKMIDLSDIPGAKVDKHSTGGVGDKVSIILAPLAASCGLIVPMMAGRGLGHSGGTIDKLESIAGYRAVLSEKEFKRILKKVGCSVIGQSEEIAPADRKLYALRDVTGTIESIPLIVGSILSKKTAEGSDALVMDIKVGSGAFMKNKTLARKLGQQLVRVGKHFGMPVRAMLTDMNQPLGYACGNSLEIMECIDVLRGKEKPFPHTCSSDLIELTLQTCAQMLVLGNVSKSIPEARKLARTNLENGNAFKRFKEMIREQGGSMECIDFPDRLPLSSHTRQWKAQKAGYLSAIQTEEIGWIIVDLGGGRKKSTDRIDPTVGLVFHKKLGSKVQEGECIATVYHQNSKTLSELEKRFHEALQITKTRKPVPKLIYEVLSQA